MTETDPIVALYAVQAPSGKWLRFVGGVRDLPIRPFWDECFTYEDWQGLARPETLELCRKLGVDVLFKIHLQRNARGNLLREVLRAGHGGLASVLSR